MFVMSCLLSVWLDPLFLHIPNINEDKKCLLLDKNLKKIALVFRSSTDVLYALNIILHIYDLLECWKYFVSKETYIWRFATPESLHQKIAISVLTAMANSDFCFLSSNENELQIFEWHEGFELTYYVAIRGESSSHLCVL